MKDNGFGTYSGDPKVIADTVTSWLENPDMLKEMKGRAISASRPNATLDIASDLADMMFESKGLPTNRLKR